MRRVGSVLALVVSFALAWTLTASASGVTYYAVLTTPEGVYVGGVTTNMQACFNMGADFGDLGIFLRDPDFRELFIGSLPDGSTPGHFCLPLRKDGLVAEGTAVVGVDPLGGIAFEGSLYKTRR